MSETILIKNRVQSIDILRGIVMVIMALDHTRDFFHYSSSMGADPMDLETTTPFFFFTRWITHFCAPVFVFLSGTSVFLFEAKGKTKKHVSTFLLTRGLWLMLVEILIIVPLWEFSFNSIDLQVIWAIGLCMVIFSGLIFLPVRVLLFIGIIIIFGHNLLDGIKIQEENWQSFLWSLLHERHAFPLTENMRILVAYPFLPWLGLMITGYCMGTLYSKNYPAAKRKNILLFTGLGLIIVFILIRSFNIYGDMHQWAVQRSPLYTFLDFIKITKYPPSLLFILITIGIALVVLSRMENVSNMLTNKIAVFGKVPFFYYIAHLFVIHLTAFILFFIKGGTWEQLDPTGFNNSNLPPSFGFSLTVTYIAWIGIIFVLYFPCRWYNNYKSNHKEKWWLSYL